MNTPARSRSSGPSPLPSAPYSRATNVPGAVGEAAATSFAFPAGPDQQGDLLLRRPYFLVPLDESEAAHASVRDRILDWIKDTYGARGVTDIYLVSHGWHRVFFSALSAYDRLFSRFALLHTDAY